jgi:hypothetical protein
MGRSSTYVYPSNCDAEGRDIAIAFDEQELDSLVKILEKEGGPIAKNLLQIFEQDDWACYSFHGRFICDTCGQEHIGVMMPKQIREFLTKLLREKYTDCQSIIKKLEEKPISYDVWRVGKMSKKYTGMHRYTLKEGEYIIPNDSYLSSGILLPLINYFSEPQRIKKEKGGKQYHFDVHTAQQILEEKRVKQYRKHDLDIAKRILEKCKTRVLTISLTKKEHSWLRPG